MNQSKMLLCICLFQRVSYTMSPMLNLANKVVSLVILSVTSLDDNADLTW